MEPEVILPHSGRRLVGTLALHCSPRRLVRTLALQIMSIMSIMSKKPETKGRVRISRLYLSSPDLRFDGRGGEDARPPRRFIVPFIRERHQNGGTEDHSQ